ncbi:MAG: hypothetical protein IJ757_00720 [Clostridiales bacterium]|nr:hypothetical protein [Clostridiales bacterium]
MESRKVLELKISYLEKRLSELPKGWFGQHRGKPIVYVNTESGKGKYRIDGKKGSYYAALVKEYKKLTMQYNDCLDTWSLNYSGTPIKYTFPLTKTQDDMVTYDYYKQSQPNQNGKEYKTKINYSNQILRSKNELLAVKEIEEMGFEWKTEICLIKNGKFFYPDIAFYVPYIEKVLLIELDGMMEKEDYFFKSENRKINYYKVGFKENKDVLFYRLSSSGDFNVEDFKTAVRFMIEENCGDICTPNRS